MKTLGDIYTEVTNIAQHRGLSMPAQVQVEAGYPSGKRLLDITDVRQGGDGQVIIDTCPVPPPEPDQA